MKEYRAYYDRILRNKEYKLVQTYKRQVQELSLEIKRFYSNIDIGSRQNIWFFIANGIIVAVANSWTENVDIFGEEW